MQNGFFRYLNPRGVIALISFLSVGLYLLNRYLGTHIGIHLSVTALIVVIFGIIDRYFWKYPPFKCLYWIPDMSGRYEGMIRYSDPITGADDCKQCVVEVFQTGSKLKARCFFQHEWKQEQSESKSLEENIVKNDDDTWSLVFTYQNEGIPATPHPHYGTNVLRFIQNGEGKFLKGYYYTNRTPQTKGSIEVKFLSNNLKNDF